MSHRQLRYSTVSDPIMTCLVLETQSLRLGLDLELHGQDVRLSCDLQNGDVYPLHLSFWHLKQLELNCMEVHKVTAKKGKLRVPPFLSAVFIGVISPRNNEDIINLYSKPKTKRRQR